MFGEMSDSPERGGADAGHQVVDRRVLQQVAARAREDRVHHVVVLVRDRQHHDARERRDRRDVARRFDAAHARHVEVHDDDVGRDLAHDAHRLVAAGRLADDLHALLLEQVAEARAEQVVVVDDEHAERLCLPPLGRLQHLGQLRTPFQAPES